MDDINNSNTQPPVSAKDLNETFQGVDDGRTPAERAKALWRQRNPAAARAENAATLFFIGQKMNNNF